MKVKLLAQLPNETPDLVGFTRFARQVGISTVTLWRWARGGLIETCNVRGRIYITREAIERFKARATAGEFAQQHAAPLAPAVRNAIERRAQLAETPAPES